MESQRLCILVIMILRSGTWKHGGSTDNVRNSLMAEGYTVTLVNARFVKPIDKDMIDAVCQNHKLIVTLEENDPQVALEGQSVNMLVIQNIIPTFLAYHFRMIILSMEVWIY